jgi:hypothetical protein
MQQEAQKLFPETSRINAENMDLFGRLTDTSAALGEAKLHSAKGWPCGRKLVVRRIQFSRSWMPFAKKNAQRDRQDKLGGVQAGVHHENIKTSVARMQNEKAATEAELQQARNAEAVTTGKPRQAGVTTEETQNALAKKEGEVQALEVVSIRLMNQIEQLEEQGCTLLEERNAAITQTGELQRALAESETELGTTKARCDSTLTGSSDSTPVQGSTATAANLGPTMTVKQWQPVEEELKHFGASRVFPETPPVGGDGSSSTPSGSSTTAPRSSSSSAAAPALSPASDAALHHRAVLANPLERGGSGVERQREIEKDYRMLKTNRDREFNKAAGSSMATEWRRQLERDGNQQSVRAPSAKLTGGLCFLFPFDFIG